ncbi:O-antigen ligase family protein [Actinoplanes sp. CA-030573]|uniref:O-antigen ligase family protein n=1 Tax=Actinoplanes sp. CA-030573 TaxID=3239898 RepID=UPI003D938BA0
MSSPATEAARPPAGLAKLVATVTSPVFAASVLFVLAVPQIYLLPQGTSDIALSTLFCVAAAGVGALGILRSRRLAIPHVALFAVLTALLVVRVAAMAWSPVPGDALGPVVLLAQFAITLWIMFAAVRDDPALLRRIQVLFWPFVVAHGFVVILFRLAPRVEDRYLHTLAKLVAGQNTAAALFGHGRNNVFDPGKSGGFFVNANVGAIFMGVCGLAALAVFAVTRTRWVAAAGVFSLVTVFFTGSKLGSLLAIGLPVLATATYLLSRSSMPARSRLLLVAAAIVIGGGGVAALLVIKPGLRGQMAEAFVGRTEIWGFGADSFRNNPLKGLGYGGWDAGFKAYASTHGVYKPLPPHNLLLAAWATTGIVGALLTAAFIGVVAWIVIRAISGRVAVNKMFAAFAGAAIAWIFIHGMAENTDVFGEIHLMPIFALLLVYLTRPIGEEAPGDVADAGRRDSETPAVPALGDVHRQSGTGTTYFSSTFRGEGSGSGDHAAGRLG